MNLSKIRETMNDLDIFKMIEEGTSSRVEREYLRSTEGGLKDFKQIGVGSKFAKKVVEFGKKLFEDEDLEPDKIFDLLGWEKKDKAYHVKKDDSGKHLSHATVRELAGGIITMGALGNDFMDKLKQFMDAGGGKYKVNPSVQHLSVLDTQELMRRYLFGGKETDKEYKITMAEIDAVITKDIRNMISGSSKEDFVKEFTDLLDETTGLRSGLRKEYSTKTFAERLYDIVQEEENDDDIIEGDDIFIEATRIMFETKRIKDKLRMLGYTGLQIALADITRNNPNMFDFLSSIGPEGQLDESKLNQIIVSDAQKFMEGLKEIERYGGLGDDSSKILKDIAANLQLLINDRRDREINRDDNTSDVRNNPNGD